MRRRRVGDALLKRSIIMHSISNFSEGGFRLLGLSRPILKAVAEEGYDSPTPVQAEAIPAVLAGRDVMAAAQTGTGKTAGFTLPILHSLSDDAQAGPIPSRPPRSRPAGSGLRALIVTPTRELAAQVEQSVVTYGRHLPLSSAVVFGGVNINPQIQKLKRGVDILVATPGRLLDLHSQGAVDFSALRTLVLDEADRMLDMGFIHDIRRILRILPPKRQNLMFSATFSNEIRALARGLITNPVEISVSPRNSTVDTVAQSVYTVDKNRKTDLLIQLINEGGWYQALVFCRTKHGANRLAQRLEKSGIEAAAIHGNKSQNARTRALNDFKSGRSRILVATDIAARGLDIDQLPQVVNFDLPNVSEDYVHRIGRTGRAGSSGEAVSLVCGEEAKLLRDIEKLIRLKLKRRSFPGFEVRESPAADGRDAADSADARPSRRSSGAPRASGTPRTPGASRTPGTSRTPGAPRTPGASRTPGTSRTSGAPRTPGTSQTLGAPSGRPSGPGNRRGRPSGTGGRPAGARGVQSLDSARGPSGRPARTNRGKGAKGSRGPGSR